jgi:hypothetical protein
MIEESEEFAFTAKVSTKYPRFLMLKVKVVTAEGATSLEFVSGMIERKSNGADRTRISKSEVP